MQTIPGYILTYNEADKKVVPGRGSIGLAVIVLRIVSIICSCPGFRLVSAGWLFRLVRVRSHGQPTSLKRTSNITGSPLRLDHLKELGHLERHDVAGLSRRNEAGDVDALDDYARQHALGNHLVGIGLVTARDEEHNLASASGELNGDGERAARVVLRISDRHRQSRYLIGRSVDVDDRGREQNRIAGREQERTRAAGHGKAATA